MEKIYVIGHKSPDLDSVAAAIAYAKLAGSLSNEAEYTPAIAGELNQETAYILEKFSISAPEKLETAGENKYILVDHNEFTQSLDGMDSAKIIEVLDHHKIDFKYSEPIKFEVQAWGSTCTIVADKFLSYNVAIDKNLAGLMLSAILVDTVITKSPTCTDKDKELISKLTEIAGIADWQAFGMEIFKVRSNVTSMTAEEMIRNDFKDFVFKSGKFGIGQIETVDITEFEGKEETIFTKLEEMRTASGYKGVILFITDIIKEGSLFLVSTDDQAGVEAALGVKLENNQVYIPGILSRKKQVAPKFTEVFDK